jgi:hypothetical protein
MDNEYKKPDRLSHILKSIEIAGIIFQSNDFISSDKIIHEYSRFEEGGSLDETSIKRFLKTIRFYLGNDLFESKPSKGYRLKEEYRTNKKWILPLFSQYLFYIESNSLNFSLESVIHLLDTNSLYKLFLLKQAMQKGYAIELEYTKYREDVVKFKKLQIYSIVLRGRKLFIVAKDLNINEVRHYIFTQIGKILKLDDSKQLEPPLKNSFLDFYKDSLESFEGTLTRKVLIRFIKEAEIFIQKEFFHSSQKFYKNEKEDLILEMQINYSEELFALLGRFLNYAELLEPVEWREIYIQKLKLALELYK